MWPVPLTAVTNIISEPTTILNWENTVTGKPVVPLTVMVVCALVIAAASVVAMEALLKSFVV